jgi:DNA-binding PadR family transcriptional regulator
VLTGLVGFQAPWKAQLTEKGRQTLRESDQEDLEAYQNLTHKELVEKTQRLENRIGKLEKKFDVFRQQIVDKVQ